MNPQDPLAQLHPLREPAAIGWWPLAPGWWLLLAAVACLLAVAAYLAWRRHKARAYRRQAETQLNTLLASYQRDQDATAFFAGVNSLLKATALRAFDHREVAAASGDQWLALLNNSIDAQRAQFDAELVCAAYKPGAPSADPALFHHTALTWIRHHKVAA